MITRKCPCCGKKTIQPLKIYDWNICSHCKTEIKAWDLCFILLISAIILRYFFDLADNIFFFMLFYSIFDGIISPLWTPLSIVKKAENNDIESTKKF